MWINKKRITKFWFMRLSGVWYIIFSLCYFNYESIIFMYFLHHKSSPFFLSIFPLSEQIWYIWILIAYWFMLWSCAFRNIYVHLCKRNMMPYCVLFICLFVCLNPHIPYLAGDPLPRVCEINIKYQRNCISRYDRMICPFQ